MQRYDHHLESSQYLSELSVNRLVVIGGLFLLAFIAIIFKMFVVVFSEDSDDIARIAEPGRYFHERKEIVDRNGELLAVNLATASLYAKPQYVFEKEEIAKKLAEIFPDLNSKELLSGFKSSKKFIWIKRNITPQEQYAVNNLGVPGLNFEAGQRRIYLQTNVLSHVLGYVDVDGNGIAGVEKYFDKFLTEKKKGDVKESLQLSIDVRVQNIVHDVLTEAMQEFKMIGAAGIVMDVKNGEILSLVSLPDFNPHFPNKANSEELFNRASLGVFELGSVFKAISFATALDSKSINLNDVYYVRNPIKAGRFTIHDYKYKQDWMSVPEILMYSSNIGTAKVIMDVGIPLQKSYLKKFGIFSKLSLELPEKGSAIYPLDSMWGQISAMTISFGHGIAITPIHFAQALSAIVNGGYLYPATLIKNGNNDKEVEQVISEETSNNMRKLLRIVVHKGSGKKSDIPGYYVGGKTGSAEKATKQGYSKNSKISTFAGAFPMYDPKYVIIIMLDAPKAKANYMTTGGNGVAPLVREVIARIGPVLEIAPVDPEDEKINRDLFIEYSTEDITNDERAL